MFDSKTDHLNWAYVSQTEVVIGPRENGFPDSAVALDGPA